MGIMEAVLAFGLRHWKLIAVIVAIASLISYIAILRWKVDHYQEKYEETKTAYLQYKSKAEHDRQDLEDGARVLSKKYEHASDEATSLREKTAVLLKEKLKNDKELSDLRVSVRALQLLNDSTREPNQQGTTSAEQDNAGEANRTNASATSVPLNEVFVVMSENNKNHLACVAQVKEWQSFWNDYTALVEGVERNNDATSRPTETVSP